ncbi:MAG: hypothetical protein H6601_11420 [Flavobacteriales bacterium]|nr:hypothetical protein [Flavobacteriales bacterium]MCB9205620.1 hypothetical protein [Flavobacteriales bacterium]
MDLVNLKNQVNSQLALLYETYENSPQIKALIQLLGPIGSVPDTVLGTLVTKIRAERLRVFFDELNSGDVELTEDIIAQNDFLHAYFSTAEYVLKTRTDEKIKRFGIVLKSWYSQKVDIDWFEDYAAIINELSDREFAILSVKYKYELAAEKNPDLSDANPYKKTISYWEEFKDEILKQMDIEPNDLDPMLIRVQRTGCYFKHIGYFDASMEQVGDTTELFKKLHGVIQKETEESKNND